MDKNTGLGEQSLSSVSLFIVPDRHARGRLHRICRHEFLRIALELLNAIDESCSMNRLRRVLGRRGRRPLLQKVVDVPVRNRSGLA